MTNLQTLALIDRVERARRRWKRLALGALAALLLVCSLGVAAVVSERQQVRAEHERAEQALRESEAHRELSRQVLYF